MYLAFIVFIMALLIMRHDTAMICVVGILTLGLLATETLSGSVAGIFNSFIYATKELIGTIFIISIIVAMSRVLIQTGVNEMMVAPLTRFLRTPALAFWGIGLIMMVHRTVRQTAFPKARTASSTTLALRSLTMFR